MRSQISEMLSDDRSVSVAKLPFRDLMAWRSATRRRKDDMSLVGQASHLACHSAGVWLEIGSVGGSAFAKALEKNGTLRVKRILSFMLMAVRNGGSKRCFGRIQIVRQRERGLFLCT